MIRNDAAHSREWRQANPHRALHYDARRRARNKAVPFSLTADEVRAMLEAAGWTCGYCGQLVGSYAGGTRPNSATLDRLVPERGYTKSNTIVCCHRCNCEKSEHTVQSLRAWAARIESLINRKNPRENT